MAIILTIIAMSFIIPMVGLAIDCGVMYVVKTSLSAAVDGSALAAGRALSLGMTLPDQYGNATSRAQSFFYANFPNGYLYTTNPTVNVAIAESGFKTRTVTVTGSVDAPTYMIRIFGFNSITVSATGQASRRDVNLIIVADRSGSMNNNNACAIFRNAATAFIANFANGRDRIGLLEFGGTTNLDYAPDVNFKSSSPTLAQVISNIICDGNTNTPTAIAEAYQQLQNINQPGALNLILLFTDGRPTALSAQFPVKTLQDTRYDPTSYTSSVDTPPSSCQDSAGRSYPDPAWAPDPITGIIATYTSYWADQGWTWGVDKRRAVSQGTDSEQVVTDESVVTGCSFNGPFSQSANPGEFRMRTDIAYIPDQDYYGNSTWGYRNNLATFPNGPYIGKLRPDVPTTLRNAAYNAADNAATKARNDASLVPIFYVIGLGGNDAEGIDHEFLRRIANVPDSAIYDSTKPQGLYIYSPTTQQLADAFSTVAGEILRISR